MNKRILLILIWSTTLFPALGAGIPVVPSRMEFAGIKLIIKEGARKEIQKDVNALHRNRKYFEIQLMQVDLYFPFIEKILKDENVPDDFKYLVIQESALVPDAVSSSNAVGFWQFKAETARELGLRIDRYVDERMNIQAATRAAARYMKTSNFYFDNWLYSLMSYQTGRGGARKLVKDKYRGADKMEINKHTYWYVKKFLAHKIAFEYETGKSKNFNVFLQEYTKGTNKTLNEIAHPYRVDSKLISQYNLWLKRGKIPDDKLYVVLIPIESSNQYGKNLILEEKILANNIEEKKGKSYESKNGISARHYDISKMDVYPIINRKGESAFYRINGIMGSISQEGDTPMSLALLGGITKTRFLKFNDLTSIDKITPGQVYYFKKKRSNAAVHFHVVQADETLWEIAQKYGIKKKKLLAKNRLKNENQVKPGMVLWMRFIRPSDVPVEYRDIEINTSPNIESGINIAASPYLFDSTTPQNNTRAKETGKKEISESEFIDEKSYIDLGKDQTNNSQTTPEDKLNAVNPNPTVVYHTVKKGETIFAISAQYGTTVESIKKWNSLINNTLDIGQVLIIMNTETPGKESSNLKENSDFFIHQVREKETLYSIARHYDVTIKQIMKWNDKEDFSVMIDDRLKIYKK